MDARLVIADSEPASRGALERFFSGCGFRVETAGDGLECLDKVRSLKPHVLVADLETPWGGAAAVAAFLHESCYEFEIPAILVTGRAPPEVLAQRTGVPESSCFQKPLSMDGLLDRVGLAIALIDLRRNDRPRRGNGRSPRPAFADPRPPSAAPARRVPANGARYAACEGRFGTSRWK